MTTYKPLTPELRRKIDSGIDDSIAELRTCEQNGLVGAQIRGLELAKNLIRTLPDGYPMPLEQTGDLNGRF